MSELAQFIMSQVESAGGVLLYPALYELTPYENRRRLPNAKKELKSLGVLVESIELENGQVLHKLTKVEAVA